MATLPDPNFIILYVENVAASAGFYSDLLGRPPIESSPNFAMFALSTGVTLGLWARHDVKPAATVTGGGGEICIAVADVEAVQSLHSEWFGRGLPIIQPPTKMDFGHTFVASDLDGHRLRVFFPTGS
jgi:catechol 2,3-dioxygenase-like lactoylglutathione lyase family enzyme